MLDAGAGALPRRSRQAPRNAFAGQVHRPLRRMVRRSRRPQLQPLFLSLAYSINFGLLHFVRASFVDIPVFDQDRYVAETSFANSFLLSIIFMWLFDFVRAGKFINKFPLVYRWRNTIAFSLTGVIILALIASIIFIPRSI